MLVLFTRPLTFHDLARRESNKRNGPPCPPPPEAGGGAAGGIAAPPKVGLLLEAVFPNFRFCIGTAGHPS